MLHSRHINSYIDAVSQLCSVLQSRLLTGNESVLKERTKELLLEFKAKIKDSYAVMRNIQG